ncbi:MAG: hypothetical protein L3K08_03590 [Thermoplasmata archaeon]|nr:hypothetical protein [Thermoplasmata archaeon]
MARRRGAWIGGPMLGILATLLLLSVIASAGPTIFLATPSYAAYGGASYHGAHVFLASGLGSNAVSPVPTFSVATGVAHEGQSSTSMQGGAHKLQVWSGVQHLNFSCPATCATGNYNITMLWNVSASIYLRTNCSGLGSHPITLASANLSLLGFVEDSSVSRHAVVGQGLHRIYFHALTGPGPYSATVTNLFVLTFALHLTTGDTYSTWAFIQGRTLAVSQPGCGSTSSILIGPPAGAVSGVTTLVHLRVA